MNSDHSKNEYECCICFRKTDSTTRLLWNTVTDEPATLNQWIPTNTRPILDTDTFFYGPCNRHIYCAKCLKNIACGFDNHPVGPQYSHIPCKPPFDGECFTLTGMTNFFTHLDIKKVLTDEEFEQYTNHVDRYQFPGFEVVKCPRPVYHNTTLSRCNTGILVSIDDIQNKGRGNVIMLCDQNEQCNRKSCYHCLNLISRYSKVCQYCINMDESKNPKSENRYFYVEGKKKKDGKNVCYRNDELTVDIVIKQLEEIVTSERVYVRCLECLVPLYKTEQCNTLSHCKIERCYCCGRSGTETQKELGDHWDTTGIKGCPRFDYSKYWNDIAECEFRCEENRCYNEEIGDCHNLDHQSGIKKMHQKRREAMVYHAIKSLLPDLREKVLQEMWKRKGGEGEEDLKNYIPQWWSTDHRTFHPDSIFRYFSSKTESRDVLSIFKPLVFEKPITEVITVARTSTSYKQMLSDLYNKFLGSSKS